MLEHDIVATIARLVWRKQNLATFRLAELARRRREAIRSEHVATALAEKQRTLRPFRDLSSQERRGPQPESTAGHGERLPPSSLLTAVPSSPVETSENSPPDIGSLVRFPGKIGLLSGGGKERRKLIRATRTFQSGPLPN
jgi:hypothetical protein